MITLTFIGGLAATWSIWLILRKKTGKKAVKIRTWAAVVAGVCLTVGGFAVIADKIAAIMLKINNSVTAWAFGAAITGSIVFVVLAEVWHAAGKGGTGGNRFVHPILGFLSASVLIAAGGVFGLSMGWITDNAQNLPELSAIFTSR